MTQMIWYENSISFHRILSYHISTSIRSDTAQKPRKFQARSVGAILYHGINPLSEKL